MLFPVPTVFPAHYSRPSFLILALFCKTIALLPTFATAQANVRPYKLGNPYLEGVTAVDLALISKHICGVEPLGTTHQLVAADVNNSHTITTFDVVELKRMILGICDSIPHMPAWIFVDKKIPATPPELPSLYEASYTNDTIGQKANLVGIKIGDVNNTTSSDAALTPALAPALGLSWLPEQLSPNLMAIPIRYTGDEPVTYFQMGLRFDPDRLDYFGALPGEVPGWAADKNLGLRQVGQGEIRTLWLPSDFNDPQQVVRPGQVLCYLTFCVKGAWPESEDPLLRLDDSVLPNRAWTGADVEHPLSYEAATDIRFSAPPPSGETGAEPFLRATCHPNPTSGPLNLTVRATGAAKGRIAFFDATGRRVFVRDVVFEAGEQTFTIPEAAALSPGLYVWKVYGKGEKTQGHFARQ